MFWRNRIKIRRARKATDLILITFASAVLSPICDIEPPVFRGYSRGCHGRPQMKTANRRESPRIDIKLPCHITSPAVWTEDSAYTENISRSGVLLRWQPEGVTASPSVGQ